MRGLRIALGQIPIDDGCREDNLRRVESVIEAAGPTHDLVILPETATSGFSSREAVAAVAEPLNGPTVGRLAGLAARHACTLVIGLAERDGDELFNTAAVIGPGGLLMSYRKTHLWSSDRPIFAPGSRIRRVAAGGYGLGALICYDVEFPEPARILSALGAEVIGLCNGNMHPYGDAHRRAAATRAQENQVFVAMANRVGAGGGETFAGGSLVAAPDGRILMELGEEEEIGSIEIDLDQVELARQRYNYLGERRIALERGAVRSAGNVAEFELPPP